MICITTRFQFKHMWQLIPFYLAYKRIKLDANAASGLIRYALLVQNPYVCYTFSIWKSEQAIMHFSNTSNHIQALRSAKRSYRAIWSAYWRIDAVSKSANQWPGSNSWPLMTAHPIHPNRLVLVF